MLIVAVFLVFLLVHGAEAPLAVGALEACVIDQLVADVVHTEIVKDGSTGLGHLFDVVNCAIRKSNLNFLQLLVLGIGHLV